MLEQLLMPILHDHQMNRGLRLGINRDIEEPRGGLLRGKLITSPIHRQLKLRGYIPTRDGGLARHAADMGRISLPGHRVSWSKSITIS